MAYVAIPVGIIFTALGLILVSSPLWEYKAAQPKKQWLNKDVYGAERIAHWAKGEVFVWVGMAGTRFYIFRDEDGGIAAVPDFYSWRTDGGRVYEPADRETPTTQPDEVAQ